MRAALLRPTSRVSMSAFLTLDSISAQTPEHQVLFSDLTLSIGAERVGLVPSSLTFHLQNLQRGGLITRRREGRQLIYSANFTAMTSLVGYLTDNCCADSAAECCPPVRQPKSAKRAVKAA